MSYSQEFKLPCSRCKIPINGHIYWDEDGIEMIATAGFYQVSGPPWNKYAEPNETILCDNCMWTEPRYLEDYPSHASSQ